MRVALFLALVASAAAQMPFSIPGYTNMARPATQPAAARPVAAPAAAPAAAPGAWVCSVTVQFDNTASELERQDKTIRKELGDEVCDLPDGIFGQSQSSWDRVVVGPTYVKDSSSLIDSNTQATYHCLGTSRDRASAETACNNCKKYYGKGAGNFGDEVEDATSFPEIEVEKVVECVLQQVPWPVKVNFRG